MSDSAEAFTVTVIIIKTVTIAIVPLSEGPGC